MSSSGSNAGMGWKRLRATGHAMASSINNSSTVPLQPTHQSDAASKHSHPALLSGRLVAELCSRCTRLRSWLFGDHKSGVMNARRLAALSYLSVLAPPLSVWPHLFCGAGHEKRRGEQLKWSLAFSLYTGSFPCAQLAGPVHTARLGRVCFCVFSLGLCIACSFVPFDLFVSPFFCVSLGS